MNVLFGEDTHVNEFYSNLLSNANALTNYNSFTLSNKYNIIDCISFVRYIYSNSGYALSKYVISRGSKCGDGGVGDLFYGLPKSYIYSNNYSNKAPGDLVFFNYTTDCTDSNGNFSNHRPLSHIGIIIGITNSNTEWSNTFIFIHYSSYKNDTNEPVNIRFMNLRLSKIFISTNEFGIKYTNNSHLRSFQPLTKTNIYTKAKIIYTNIYTNAADGLSNKSAAFFYRAFAHIPYSEIISNLDSKKK